MNTATSTTTTTPVSPLNRLRSASPKTTFTCDIAVTAAFAALLAVLPGDLREFLGLPAPLIRVALLILVPFVAAMVWFLAMGARNRPVGRFFVIGNAAWVLASFAVVIGPGGATNVWGDGFILGQALAVGALACWQWHSLRKSTPA